MLSNIRAAVHHAVPSLPELLETLPFQEFQRLIQGDGVVCDLLRFALKD
jgi:hypothetical protein